MEIVLAATAGATAGLASAAHCAAMCGPLAGYACRGSADGARGSALRTRYQAGRAISYVTAGAVVGAAGEQVLGALPTWLSLALAGFLALAMTVYGVVLWTRGQAAMPGARPANDRPVALRGRGPQKLRSPGLAQRLMRGLAKGPLTLGLTSVLLPCGALWAALLIAAGTTSAVSGAAAMGGFALVSGASVAGSAWLIERMRGLGAVGARACAVALILGAALLAYRPAAALASFASGDSSPATVPCPIHPGMELEVSR